MRLFDMGRIFALSKVWGWFRGGVTYAGLNVLPRLVFRSLVSPRREILVRAFCYRDKTTWIVTHVHAERLNTGTMGHRGTWREPTEPDGTTRNANRRALRRRINFLLGSSRFGSSRFLLSSPIRPTTHVSVVSKRLLLAWGDGI